MKLEHYLIGFFFIIFIIFVFVTKYNEKFEGLGLSETHCVCSFDIDGTITCNLDNANKAIKECKKRGCHININTARLQFDKYNNDLNYTKLGLTTDDIQDVFTGDHDQYGTSFYNDSLPLRIAKTKVNNLKKTEDRYKIPRSRIILFDDVIENVNAAKNAGFSSIHANNSTCGLNQNVTSDISEILGF